MKILKIMIVLLILIMTVGAVCAAENSTENDISTEILQNSQNEVYTTSEASFTNLTDEIENAGTTLDLTKDYAFNNETDNNTGILISKDNFVLNGNGHTIDAKNQSRIFNVTANLCIEKKRVGKGVGIDTVTSYLNGTEEIKPFIDYLK